ncbi:hypothetical protein TWF696_006150 [Orbilia brochopaga]|uniref:F-box domain-containing protein n=1 Tax=Orbilia brochopaga TaxID=3140254 RepID=A0AAV9UVB8_9PEZI
MPYSSPSISDLPVEVARMIFVYIPVVNLPAVRLTSHWFNEIASECLFKTLILDGQINLQGLNINRLKGLYKCPQWSWGHITRIDIKRLDDKWPRFCRAPVASDDSELLPSDSDLLCELKDITAGRIKSLKLSSSMNQKVDNLIIDLIAANPQIQSLDLSLSPYLMDSETFAAALAQVTNLRSFGFDFRWIDFKCDRDAHAVNFQSMWDLLKANANIEHLRFDLCNRGYYMNWYNYFIEWLEWRNNPAVSAYYGGALDPRRFYSTYAAHWPSALKLKTLQVGHTQFLESLYYSCNIRFFDPKVLKKLSLVMCPDVDGFLLRIANELESIRSLYFIQCVRTDTVNRILAVLPPLEELYLSMPLVGDPVLLSYDALGRHRQSLKTLFLETPNEFQEFSRTDSPRRAMQSLREYRGLEELALSGTPHTLERAEFPPNLRVLRIIQPEGSYYTFPEERFQAAIKQFCIEIVKQHSKTSTQLQIIAHSAEGYLAEYHYPAVVYFVQYPQIPGILKSSRRDGEPIFNLYNIEGYIYK